MLKRILLAAFVAACISLPARATLTTTTSIAQYTSNGVTVAYSFPYRFLDNSHLVVTKTVAAVTTTLVLGTDYTVTGANLTAGGTVTLTVAVANGGTLKIARSTPKTQTCNFRVSSGAPNGKAVEDCLDRAEMQIQEMNDGTFTSLIATPITTAQASIAAPSTVPNSSNTNVTGVSAAFAAADHVHAVAVGPMVEATTAAGQSITSGVTTIVVFGTEVRDTDATYDNATGRFTVPAGKGGDYLVASCITWSGAPGVNPSVGIFKNAANYKAANAGANTPGAAISICISAVANFAAADVIDMRVTQVSGGAVTLTANALFNFITIKRIQ